MSYQLDLVSELKILLGDIDPIENFCSFQDTLKSKIKINIQSVKKYIKRKKCNITCAEPDSMPEQCLVISL